MSREKTPVCICGHTRSNHPAARTKSGSACMDRTDWRACGCEGWQEPAKPGERLVFGVSRIPKKAAVTAPAWSLDSDE